MKKSADEIRAGMAAVADRPQVTKEECRSGRAATADIFDAIDLLLDRGHIAVARDQLTNLRAAIDQMWKDAETFAPEGRTE